MAAKKLFHVTCNLPFASTNINGVEFEKLETSVRTKEPVAREVAAQFHGIPGYTIEDSGKAPDPVPAPAAGDKPIPPVAPAGDDKKAPEGAADPEQKELAPAPGSLV